MPQDQFQTTVIDASKVSDDFVDKIKQSLAEVSEEASSKNKASAEEFVEKISQAEARLLADLSTYYESGNNKNWLGRKLDKKKLEKSFTALENCFEHTMETINHRMSEKDFPLQNTWEYVRQLENSRTKASTPQEYQKGRLAESAVSQAGLLIKEQASVFQLLEERLSGVEARYSKFLKDLKTSVLDHSSSLFVDHPFAHTIVGSFSDKTPQTPHDKAPTVEEIKNGQAYRALLSQNTHPLSPQEQEVVSGIQRLLAVKKGVVDILETPLSIQNENTPQAPQMSAGMLASHLHRAPSQSHQTPKQAAP